MGAEGGELSIRNCEGFMSKILRVISEPSKGNGRWGCYEVEIAGRDSQGLPICVTATMTKTDFQIQRIKDEIDSEIQLLPDSVRLKVAKQLDSLEALAYEKGSLDESDNHAGAEM